MTDLTKMVIATAMRKMFEQRHFDICTVDQCLKVAGIIPPKQTYELLRTLHCVDYGAMPRELAEKIPSMLNECFSGLNIEELMRDCEPAQRVIGGPQRRLQ